MSHGGTTQTRDTSISPSDIMTLNFGPQHPATHGTFRLVMQLDGETILDCDPDPGYLHSGFEKQAEHMDYNQYVTIVDRMNYMSPMSNDVAFHLAVEKLFGIEVPERAQYIRTIMAEVARLEDHSFFLGTPALDLGAVTPFLWSFVGREECYDVMEWVTGARYNTSYTRVGGLMSDVPDDFPEMIKYVCDNANPEIDELVTVLAKNPIWQARTKDIGILSEEDANSYGVTGPVARASGIARDLRKDQPYLVYDRFDFDIPIGDKGDCFDRYMVRVEEMRQSVRIIEQAIRELPDGPVNVDPGFKLTLPPKQQVYSKMEELIHHFEIVMPNEGYAPPKGEAYGCIESPNGELGFYVVSDGSKFPVRVRTRPPSFLHYQLMPLLMEGRVLSDVVSVLSSLNLIAAEVDR